MLKILSQKKANDMQPNLRCFSFVGGHQGTWQVISQQPYRGENLPEVTHLEIVNCYLSKSDPWVLHGVTSHERYVTRDEKSKLLAVQENLGRPEATHAALIPIRKSAAWWGLTQDERRQLFEETSHHTRIGLEYLPAIARRLHHCRDLSEEEPFDFLTWFEFAPEHVNAFEDLVHHLRETEEWHFVEREIDFRLIRT
jgi:chlorite dismutase